MRLLCIDHYFGQDIEALRAAAPPGTRCWAVSYDVFFARAVEHFPEEVFTGIEAYLKPEYTAARASYAAVARQQFERLYRIYRFDAVLAPSDTFFWVRPVIEACSAVGIPFVVLQKEATIPPGWMDTPAREWGEISPFIADHMLVSSEHHRQFWINAGVEPGMVVVTGQPRFDLYARPELYRTWAELGVATPSRPTVLFLTYDASAYLPVIDRTGLSPWLRLRTETELALVELVQRGRIELLIKPHPQPAEDQSAHLARLASVAGVRVLDPYGDVRQYIVNADVVVGFQSTALLEALAAGTPTIYTWWTDEALARMHELIPFHEEEEALAVARSPANLNAAIEQLLAKSKAGQSSTAERLVNLYLGPVDGQAGERCWREIERIVRTSSLTSAGERLASSARSRPVRAVVGAAAAAGVWTLTARFAGLAYITYRLRGRLMKRRHQLVDKTAFRNRLGETRQRAIQDLTALASR